MASIALETFLKTGEFGSIRLGMTRAQIRGRIGRPQVKTTKTDSHGRPIMWKYGDIELTFDPDEDSLVAVTLEMAVGAVPTGWQRLGLDPWELRGGMAPEEVEAALNTAAISYAQLPARFPGDVLTLETAVGVRLGFIGDNEEDWSLRGLHHVLFMDWSTW